MSEVAPDPLRERSAALPPGAPDRIDLAAAAERLEGLAVGTPLRSDAGLDAIAGGEVLLKDETAQRTGSFKFRGAYNAVSQMPATAGGVVAYSSGNHALGVAEAARLCRMRALLVCPRDAPVSKLEGVRARGAEIVLYDRRHDQREAIAAELAARRGAVLLPSADHRDVIAGQATVAREIFDAARARGRTIAHLLAPTGGGGLLAGAVLAAAACSPATQVWAVEPEGFDDFGQSIMRGAVVRIAIDSPSLCDGLLAPEPARLPFGIALAAAVRTIVVTDAEVCRAMAFAHDRLGVTLEPSGAVALAAIIAGRFRAPGETTAAILSGGNVAPDVLAACIAAGRG